MTVNADYIKNLLRLSTMNVYQKEFAKLHKLSTADLCWILKGDIKASNKFANVVGYTKIGRDLYEKVA